MKKRYIIINKFRFTTSMIIILIILSFIFNAVFSLDKAYGSIKTPQYKEVLVVEGDTLWSIASEHETRRTDDIRELIYYIQLHNQLDDAMIYPGQLIKIPIN